MTAQTIVLKMLIGILCVVFYFLQIFRRRLNFAGLTGKIKGSMVKY